MIKFLGLFFITMNLTAVFAGTVTSDPASDNDWHRFKLQHRKQYDQQEELKRYRIFRNNLERIKKLNDDNEKINGERPYDVNDFTDMEPAEFANMYLGYRKSNDNRNILPSTEVKSGSANDDLVAPNEVDWCQKGACTPIKNQGGCGSCYAHSVIEEMESMIFVSSGLLPAPLSVQQVTSCADAGCGGGFMTTSFDYMVKAGVESDSAWPYTSGNGNRGSCSSYDSKSVVAQMSGWKYGIPSCDAGDCKSQSSYEPQLMEVVAAQGPASIAVDATSMQYYSSGVLASGCSSSTSSLNHAVQLTGYGTAADGSKYWIIRNSWGSGYGEKGFVRVKMGSNMCGMDDFVTYALGAKTVGPTPTPTPIPTPTPVPPSPKPTPTPTPTPTPPAPVRMPSLSVYTDKSVYMRGSGVQINFLVKSSAQNPVPNAQVNLSLTKPNGVTLRAMGVTDSTGVFWIIYPVQFNDLPGTYRISATTYVEGVVLVNTANFIVQ